MTKVVELFSDEAIHLNNPRELETATAFAEGNLLTEFKSKTFQMAKMIETKVKLVLDSRSLNPKYHIIVTANEGKNGAILKNVFVLLEDKEQEQFVMDSLTEKNLVNRNIISINSAYLPEHKIVITELQKFCQDWADGIQDYLSNCFGYHGLTKVTAVSEGGIIKDFDVTISGKGVNDKMVSAVKLLSCKVEGTFEVIDYNTIFTTINDAFEQVN